MMFAQEAARLSGVTAWLLGWRPAEFWRATPGELLAILEAASGPVAGDAPPDGATIARLMERFPDG